MIYAVIVVAAFAVGVGFTVAATLALVVQHRREEAAARLYAALAALDEAIALAKAVDIDPDADLTYQAMCFEAWEGEMT